MTSAEKRTILEAAIARAYTAIAETSGAEMKDERFGDLLFNINTLEHLAIKHDGTKDDCHEPNDDVGEPNSFPGHPDAEPHLEPEPATVVDEQEENAAQELEKEPEKPGSEKPEEVYKDWQVRAALANLRTKTGASPKEILASFGFNGFTSVPADKNPEIMKAVKEQERAHAS